MSRPDLAAYLRAEEGLDVGDDLEERDAARERYREAGRALLARLTSSPTLRALGAATPLADEGGAHSLWT
jgi:hypothetical protein